VEESKEKKNREAAVFAIRSRHRGSFRLLSAIRRDDRVSLCKSLDFLTSGGHSCKMSTATLPLLLPASVLGVKSEPDPQEWKPSKHLQVPQPPPMDDSKQHDQEMAAARQLIDGKAFKKVRPRRTVDYFAGVGRWTLVSFRPSRPRRVISPGLQLRKTSSSPRYLPYMRPAAPYIIDVRNPLDPMHLYQYLTEYIVLFTRYIFSSSHLKPTRGTLRHRYVPSSFTHRQTRFGVR